MSRKYRIVANEAEEQTTYKLLEVLHDDQDRPVSCAEDSSSLSSSCLQDLRSECDLMRLAFFRPCLEVRFEGNQQVLEAEDSCDTTIDEFHRHEALDRAAIFGDQFESYVASHPVIARDSNLRSQADEIGRRLAELYQAVGRLDDVSS